MAPRPPNDRLPPTPGAARLAAFAKGLGCDVGIERSCKLSPGRVEGGRFLLSYGADERTARLTGRLLKDLAFPSALQVEFEAEAEAARARFLHLGYEDSPRGPLLKVYCEGEPDGQGGPLYTAYKWRPGVADAWSIDDYWRRDAGAAASFIRTAFGPDLPELSRRCLALADAEQGGEAGLLLLEVERRGAGRRSFDLRLYGGDLKLADARALIEAAEDAFALGDQAWTALDPMAERELGHLSGGRDDAGAPFLTLYYGAKAFA